MKDQVDVLVERGVKAASLDSTLSADTTSWVKAEVLSGSMQILYVAPERLNNEGFIHMMSQVKVSLLAVDEAHCISQVRRNRVTFPLLTAFAVGCQLPSRVLEDCAFCRRTRR
jgi:superfamily II DNA helicase RecQ